VHTPRFWNNIIGYAESQKIKNQENKKPKWDFQNIR